MPKNPLNTPFQESICKIPNPQTGDCNYLEHVEGDVLKMKNDASVLKVDFYSPGDSLNWSKAALDSPMGTAIPNPNRP